MILGYYLERGILKFEWYNSNFPLESSYTAIVREGCVSDFPPIFLLRTRNKWVQLLPPYLA